MALAQAAPGAKPPALFMGATPERAVPEQVKPGVVGRQPAQEAVRRRVAQLDFETLAAAREAAARRRPAAVRLNLFEDAEFEWMPERAAATASGYSLSGPLAGVEWGTATLVANGGMVVGSGVDAGGGIPHPHGGSLADR